MSETPVTQASRHLAVHSPHPEQPFVVGLVGEDGTGEIHYPARDPFDALGQLVTLLTEASAPTRGAWRLHPDWPEPIRVMVRYRRGVVGESQRVEHIVTLSPGQWHDENLTAGCQANLTLTDVDIVDPFSGMPCPVCVARSPLAWEGSRA